MVIAWNIALSAHHMLIAMNCMTRWALSWLATHPNFTLSSALNKAGTSAPHVAVVSYETRVLLPQVFDSSSFVDLHQHATRCRISTGWPAHCRLCLRRLCDFAVMLPAEALFQCHLPAQSKQSTVSDWVSKQKHRSNLTHARHAPPLLLGATAEQSEGLRACCMTKMQQAVYMCQGICSLYKRHSEAYTTQSWDVMEPHFVCVFSILKVWSWLDVLCQNKPCTCSLDVSKCKGGPALDRHHTKAWYRMLSCSWEQTPDLHGNHHEMGYFSRPHKIAPRSWNITSFLPMKQWCYTCRCAQGKFAGAAGMLCRCWLACFTTGKMMHLAWLHNINKVSAARDLTKREFLWSPRNFTQEYESQGINSFGCPALCPNKHARPHNRRKCLATIWTLGIPSLLSASNAVEESELKPSKVTIAAMHVSIQ